MDEHHVVRDLRVPKAVQLKARRMFEATNNAVVARVVTQRGRTVDGEQVKSNKNEERQQPLLLSEVMLVDSEESFEDFKKDFVWPLKDLLTKIAGVASMGKEELRRALVERSQHTWPKLVVLTDRFGDNGVDGLYMEVVRRLGVDFHKDLRGNWRDGVTEMVLPPMRVKLDRQASTKWECVLEMARRSGEHDPETLWPSRALSGIGIERFFALWPHAANAWAKPASALRPEIAREFSDDDGVFRRCHFWNQTFKPYPTEASEGRRVDCLASYCANLDALDRMEYAMPVFSLKCKVEVYDPMRDHSDSRANSLRDTTSCTQRTCCVASAPCVAEW